MAVARWSSPPPLPSVHRECEVRSIASGFFAHVSLVIDGWIRCDDLSRETRWRNRSAPPRHAGWEV